MGFVAEDFCGPYPIRLVVTWAFVFAVCTIWWLIVAGVGRIFDMNFFLSVFSGLVVTVMMGTWGIALSQPQNLIDEDRLETACKKKLEQLEREVENASTKTGSVND